METNQTERENVAREGPTRTEIERAEDQRAQVEAQAAGDTGAELKAFAREVLHDQAQFPRDVVEDSKDPDRRVDEEQGTVSQPGSEPAERR